MIYQIKTTREIFSAEELQIIERHGHAFERLMNGERAPRTEAQKRFIQVCRDEAEPESVYELAWSKYLNRLQWETDPANDHLNGPPPKADEGFGGSREAIKRMRRAGWSEAMRRSRD